MKRLLSVFILSLAGLGLGNVNVHATVLTWNGSTSTDWNNATNWLPQQVPTASDHVIFSSGSLTGPTNGASSAFAIMDWSGGNLYGSVTVASGAVLNLGGSSGLMLFGSLTNAGTVNCTNTSYLQLRYIPGNGLFGSIYNLAGGLFNIENDVFYLTDYTGSEFFNNAGTLRKSMGTGATQIYLPINNTGTIDAESGTIDFNTGGLITGQFNTATVATIAFVSGNYTVDSTLQLTGAGAFKFSGTTLTLPNNVFTNLQMLGGTLVLGPAFQGGSITNLTLPGMTLSGSNVITGTLTLGNGGSGPLLVASGATLNWTGGFLCFPTGSVTVASSAVINLGGSATLTLFGALTNAGAVNCTNPSTLQLRYSTANGYFGSIYNLAGGLFNIENDSFALGAFTGSEFFNNAGTLRKSMGTGATQIYVPINNTGEIDAESGTIDFNTGGQINGQFNAAAVGTIAFVSGNYSVGSALQLTGTGAFKFTGTTLTLPNNVFTNLQMLGGTLVLGPAFQGGSITNLTLAGMTLAGSNVITGTVTLGNGGSGSLLVASGATLNWTGGNLCFPTGSVTVASSAVMNLGGSMLGLYGPLTNAGTVYCTNTGQLRVDYSVANGYFGSIYNQLGGLFNIGNDLMSLNAMTGSEVFNNAGTLRKSAASGATQIYLLINNTGFIDAESGTIDFNTGGQINGQFNAATVATIAFASGNYTVGSALQLTGTGAFKFNGTTLTLPNNVYTNLQMLGGTLYLGPAFQGGSITNLALAGMTLAGSNVITGTLTLGNGGSGPLLVASGGVVNWTGGFLCFPTGSVTVASSAVMNLGGSMLGLYGPLTNAGTVNCTNTGQLRVDYATNNGYYGFIYNAPGGSFNIGNDSMSLNALTGTESFNNAGTLRKSAGTGATQIYIAVTNNGLIEADSGTLQFQINPNLSNGEVRSGLNSLSNYGKISIVGNATLTGTIGVTFLGGYVPVTNNSFAIFSFGTNTGIFTNLDLPVALLWATNYTATTFSVTVASMDKLAFTSQPVGGLLTNVILAPVVVQVETPTGVPVATNGVTVTLLLTNGSGIMFGTLIQNTDATGKATFGDLKFNQTGFKTLRASAASETAATSVVFKIVMVEEGQWTTNGFLLSLYGTNNLGTTTIYATTNLSSAWIPVYTNLPTTNAIQFLDAASTNYRARYYRVGVQ